MYMYMYMYIYTHAIGIAWGFGRPFGCEQYSPAMATVLFFEVKKSLRKRQRSLELLGEPPRYSLRFWGLDPLGFILGSRNVVGQGELLTIIFRFLKDRNICHSNQRTVDHH